MWIVSRLYFYNLYCFVLFFEVVRSIYDGICGFYIIYKVGDFAGGIMLNFRVGSFVVYILVVVVIKLVKY